MQRRKILDEHDKMDVEALKDQLFFATKKCENEQTTAWSKYGIGPFDLAWKESFSIAKDDNNKEKIGRPKDRYWQGIEL